MIPSPYNDNADDPTNYEVPEQYRCALKRGHFLTLVNQWGEYVWCMSNHGFNAPKYHTAAHRNLYRGTVDERE
jgi:hypothetical protein